MKEPTTEIEIRTEAVTTMQPPTASPHQALVERLKDYGQEDVFALWEELSPEERDLLVTEIEVNRITLFHIFQFRFLFFFLTMAFAFSIQRIYWRLLVESYVSLCKITWIIGSTSHLIRFFFFFC